MISDFSTVLVTLRKERGISQKQAAKELHISQALLSHYENGVREPKFEFVDKVCLYYGVSADFILGRIGASSVTINCASAPSVKAAEKTAAIIKAAEAAGNPEFINAAAEYIISAIREIELSMSGEMPDSMHNINKAVLFEKMRVACAGLDTAQINDILKKTSALL